MTKQKSIEPRGKVIGVPLSKAMQKDSDGTLTIRGYFTSDRKDEVGDIITRSATEAALPKYREWGNIRYMHLPRPVAKVIRIGESDGLEWNEVEIKVVDPQAVFEVEQGLLTALSVGILINFEDIEMLEDGGWVINGYTLAEISLVDHPANYDAKLKQRSDQDLRQLVRQYGLDAIAVSMQTILDKENYMKNDGDITAPEDAEDVLPEVDAVLLDNEKSVSDEPSEPQVDATSDGSAEPEYVRTLIAAMRDLSTVITETVASLKALAEARSAIEQSSSDDQQPDEVADDKSVDDSAPIDTEAGPPVERKGAVPETEVPGNAVPETAKTPVTDLRAALVKHFQARLG